MGSRSRSDVNYTNPCLTMHQPWASLLVYGIKRIEGRSWPSPVTGRLWIHAAGKVPEPETIKAMEDFYKQLYALDGVTDLKFPQHYPVSMLIGCVDVVGCVKSEELASWEDVPQGVRMEGLTPFCWLCEQPQKLLVPFEMRGKYNLEKKKLEAALRGLCPVEPPLRVKFPLPDPRNPLSLKPGSLVHGLRNGTNKSKTGEGSSPDLAAAIAGARAAANQFSKKTYGPTTTAANHFTKNTHGPTVTAANQFSDKINGPTVTAANPNLDKINGPTVTAAKPNSDKINGPTVTAANPNSDKISGPTVTAANPNSDKISGPTVTAANPNSDKINGPTVTAANKFSKKTHDSTTTAANQFTKNTYGPTTTGFQGQGSRTWIKKTYGPTTTGFEGQGSRIWVKKTYGSTTT